ncbi:MAG: hypothetical protein K0M45_01215 [Candidatus Paracaedibacteraceae bacterium]|nr:hypothetical protein [Candidatus Paracaedibacteraceae bacterium]
MRKILNLFLPIFLFASPSSGADKIPEGDLIPVKRVQSGDQTLELYTGVPYHIINKDHFLDNNDWHPNFQSQEKLSSDPNYIYQIWYIKETGETKGTYKILNRQNNTTSKLHFLFNNDEKGLIELEPTDRQASDPKYAYQTWKFRDMGDGTFKIIKLAHGNHPKSFLDNTDDWKLSLSAYDNQPSESFFKNQIWRFRPVGYTFTVNIDNFTYPNSTELLEKSDKQVSLLLKAHIDNRDSAAEYSEQFFQKKDLKETFALSFKENIKAIVKTTLEVQIPFTVSQKTELGLEAGFEAGQTTTTERLTSIEVRKDVKVPPHTYVQIESYVKFVNDLKLPFTARATIKAEVDRLAKDNDTARAKVKNPNSVKHFLKDSDFKVKKITGVNGNAVLAKLTGTFTGSYGIDSYTNLTDPYGKDAPKS